jgi:putative transposase
MTRLRHFDHLGTARFVTFSCYRRFRVFDADFARQIMIVHIERLRTGEGINLLGYVIMPEHLHLVLWPPDECKLGLAIGQMKARAALEILAAWPGAIPDLLRHESEQRRHQVFQRRCYDHNCRMVDTVREKITYCHKNAVARGLVSSPEEWLWSSHNWYQGRHDVPLAMDVVEL